MKLFIAKLLILLGIINQPIQTPTLPKTPQITPILPENSTPIATTTPAGLESVAEVPIIGERGGSDEQNNPECFCGTYVRQRSKWQPPKAENVKDIITIKFAPAVGAWVLFTYNHAAIVEELMPTPAGMFIRISEKNRNLDCKVEERILRADDKSIRGFFWY